MGSEWDSVDEWRKFFQKSGRSIFEVIEYAVMVGATDHPEEFKSRRDRFGGHLLSFKLHTSSVAASNKQDDKNSDQSRVVDCSSKRKATAATSGSSSDTAPCSISSFGGEVVPVVVDEEEKCRAKLENSKRRIREGYQREENAKKLRRAQVIDLKDLPKQDVIGNHKVRRIGITGRR